MKRKAIRYGFAGLTGLALFGAILSGTRHAPARADASNYTNQRRQIRACVLVSGAAQDAGANNLLAPSNTQPYVFYAMDKGNDLKPAGFEFINPLAPGVITPAIYNRWLNRIPNGGTDRAFVNGSQESALFQVNQPVTKNMGAYWEMNLDNLSAASLQQYDVVYIPLHGGRNPLAPGGANSLQHVRFTAAERELLRHYVDAGGTVWLENAGEGAAAFASGNTTPPENPDSFFESLNTATGPVATDNVSVLSAHHPLVNYPYQINQQDAYSLGLYAPANAVFVGADTQGGARRLDAAALPIISKGLKTTVWASDYGAGHVLVTSASIGGDINNYQIANNAGSSVIGVNDGAITGDNLGNIPASDMKLAYNLVSWISAVPTPGSNQRRTGSTQETIGSTLTPKWSPIPITPQNPIEPATIASGNPGSGATIYKGMAFWVDGNNWFHAYNVNPGLSLNNNNILDAGIMDQAIGASYDQVWTDSGKVLGDPTTDRVSTPTLISQYDGGSGGNGTTYEVAVVTTTTGGTFFYDAFPRAGGQLASSYSTPIAKLLSGGDLKPALNPNGGNGGAPTPSAGLPYGQNSPKPVPAPAYSDGILFTVVFTNGLGPSGELGWRIAPIDMLASLRAQKPLSVFDNAQSPLPPSSKGYGLAPSADFNGQGLPGYNTPSGSLTVGEVQSTESDAIDRMIYVPIAADLGAQPQGAAGVIHGIWFSSRNDTLRQDLVTDPNGATFKLNGRRARVPWYTSTGAASTVNLMPVVHVIRRAGLTDSTIIGMNTYNYPADFDVTYTTEAANTGANNFAPNANSHNTHVVFHSGVTLPNTYDDVRVDYTVDWPGNTVGNINAVAPSQEDMALIASQHDFALITPGPNQMMSETTGGITLSSLDNILYTITNLHDLSGGAGGTNTPPVEDRVVSGRDQYASLAVGTRPRAGRASGAINWTFAPSPGRQFDSAYGGGKFGNYQSQPRLTYHGAPIYNFKAVGPPVTYNGTVYVVGMGFSNPPGTGAVQPAYTVILALRENIDATIDLGVQNTQDITTLRLVQPSLLDPQNPITLTNGATNSGPDFTVEAVPDPVSGGTKVIAHILNFQPDNNRDAFNTALPVWIQNTTATGQNTYGQPIINGATGFGPLDNLQSYIVIPYGTTGTDANGNLLRAGITPTSGPSVSGNTLYFAADIGFRNGGTVPSTIVSVDLLRSSGIQGDYQDASKNFIVTVPQNNVFMDITSHNELSSIMPSVHPPLGTTNVLLAPNAQNLVGLDNGLILIADSKRLLEVDAGGNASWSLESTVTQSPVGGPTLATGGQALTAIPLRSPATATRYALNEFVMADTGNSRIVSANRGATTRYEIAGFRDDIKFLLPGDPITLNAPTDVQTFVETYPNGYSVLNRDTKVTYTYASPCSVYHYLIADGGNYRIVDVADIYDNNTGGIANLTGSDGSVAQGSKLLIFLSRSLGEQNQRLRYRTIQQFRQDGYDYIISCVSNVRQGNTGGAGVLGNDNTNFEGPGGSIMAIQRTANDPANPTGQVGDTVRIVNSIIVQNSDNTLRRQAISNPTWFKEFGAFDPQAPNANGGKITPHFLMADANGCYILKIASVTLNGQTTQEYVTDWMLSNQDYYYLTGRKLQAACIQRENLSDVSDRNLFEPRLLITNSYSGADDLSKLFGINSQSPVNGEVFEIKASDYYPSKAMNKTTYGYQFSGLGRYATPTTFNALGSITRMIPTEYFKNNALRRTIGSADNSLTTYSLQKPQYAERPF